MYIKAPILLSNAIPSWLMHASQKVWNGVATCITRETVFLDWCVYILWYCAVQTKRIHKVHPVICRESLCAISFIN